MYFLRSRGLLHGLAAGTNWVFRDESAHMAFAFEVVATVRREEPELFDAEMRGPGAHDVDEAVECETQFAEDLLAGGVAGLSRRRRARNTSSTAPTSGWRRSACRARTARRTRSFMELQDVQEVTNFFERRVSAYQVGVAGEIVLDAAF